MENSSAEMDPDDARWLLMAANSCVDANVILATDWTMVSSVRAIIGLVYGLIFCIGVAGNLGVIVKVVNNRTMHSARNIFLLSLIASDVVLCLTAVPFTPLAVIMKRWIFGGILCRLIPLCQSMSVIITSLSLTAIAVDKYVHIVDATRAPVTLHQALMVIGLIWAVACLLNMPLMLSYHLFDGSIFFEEYQAVFCGEFCEEKQWSSEEYRRAYGTTVMATQFVLPMVIIIFCYYRIMLKVSRDMMIENKQFSRSLTAVQRSQASRKKRKVNYILIMMVVAFVGSWFPLTLFNILRDYAHLPSFVNDQPHFWALVAHSTAMTTVIWNPLLFFWLTRRRRGRSSSIGLLASWNPLTLLLRRSRTNKNWMSTSTEQSYVTGNSVTGTRDCGPRRPSEVWSRRASTVAALQNQRVQRLNGDLPEMDSPLATSGAGQDEARQPLAPGRPSSDDWLLTAKHGRARHWLQTRPGAVASDLRPTRIL